MSDHDQATSLDHAHRLIKTLSDHIAALHKRLDAHEQRLASHALKHDGHQQAATALRSSKSLAALTYRRSRC